MTVLPKTGILDFSWNNIPDVDGYYARMSKNGLLIDTFNTSLNYLSINKLSESDYVQGVVYPYIGDNIYPTGIELQKQSMPITNFHEQGKTFEFNSIKIDGLEVPLVKTSSGYYSTGEYQNGNANIAFELTNPRDSKVLTHPLQEPFLDKIEYETSRTTNELSNFSFSFLNESTVSSSQEPDLGIFYEGIMFNENGGFTANTILGNGVFSSEYISDDSQFKITFVEAGEPIDAKAAITLIHVDSGWTLDLGEYGLWDISNEMSLSSDFGLMPSEDEGSDINGNFHKLYLLYYGEEVSSVGSEIQEISIFFFKQKTAYEILGSGITGNITLLNEPVSINGVHMQSQPYDVPGSGLFNIIPSFDLRPSSIEYVLLNKDKTSHIVSGHSIDVDNFQITIPLRESGYLSLTPYDWLGSGSTFNRLEPIFIEELSLIDSNKITNFESNLSDSHLNIDCNYKANNEIGSFFEYSVDSTDTSSFSLNSYLTGQSESLVQLSFDHFSQRTGIHTDFYISLNLYRSGSRTLDDSAKSIIKIPKPKISKADLNFDYYNGSYFAELESTPSFTFSGLELLISTGESSNFEVSPEGLIEMSGSSAYIHSKLVNSHDNSLVYDESLLTGKGLTPSIDVSTYTPTELDGSNFFFFSNPDGIPINEIKVHRKESFYLTSGNLNATMSGLQQFEDYDNFHTNSSNLGLYSDSAPPSIKRASEFSTTGINFSGYYSSGREYIYRFTPIGAFGSGSTTDPIIKAFTQNEISVSSESSLIVAEKQIESIQHTTVFTSGNQDIFGEKTFLENISTINPTEADHAATKEYTDGLLQQYSVMPPSIRDTFSQINTGVNEITGSKLYLTNILYDGFIFINGHSGDYSLNSFFYPIECTGLQAQNSGQLSYFSGESIDSSIPSPSPSSTPTVTPTQTPTTTPTPTLTQTPSITPSRTPGAQVAMYEKCLPTPTATPTITPSLSQN